MEYNDPILSQFKDKERLNAEIITELIDVEERKAKEGSYDISNELQEEVLSKCKESVAIYTDLVKLNFLLAKSWDLKTLDQSVILRFGVGQIGGSEGSVCGGSDGKIFCKDIALKTISKCDKLSLALEQLGCDLGEIMRFLKKATEKYNVRVLFNDGMTLLMEIWVVCGQCLKRLKRKVASFFMKSKLLLIDYELEQIEAASLNKIMEPESNPLHETIISYKSFIKVFVQQLSDAENFDDVSEFEECVAIFIDVEGMYQAFNCTWLLQENNALLRENKLEYQAKWDSDQRDLEDLAQINEFMDNSLTNADKRTSETNSDQNHNALSITTDNYRVEPLFNSQEKNEANTRDRRLSGMSEVSDISMMMQKTSLRKELPHLLQAFQNIKKLSNELEMVRENGILTPPINSPINSPNSWSSYSNESSPSPSSGTRQLTNMNLKSIKSLGTTGQRNHELSGLPNNSFPQSPLSKLENSQQLIRKDMQRLMAQTPDNMRKAPLQTNVPGFSSNVLNNLYGIGSRK